MNFKQLLIIVRARYKTVLLTLFLVVSTTLTVSLLLPKTYKATATLILNYKGTDPLTGVTLPAQLMPGYMATQLDIINSSRLALRVVDELRLEEEATLLKSYEAATNGHGDMREWLAGLLLSRLEVLPSHESGVLQIKFEDGNPNFAALAANAFATSYQQLSVQLKVEPLQKASGYLAEQVQILRTRLEKAQNRLSTYQRNHGISNIDNRLDVESERLNGLSAQLVNAQTQLMEVNSRQYQAERRKAESPDVLANPIIQSMKISLATAEAKFSETAERFTKNHPYYQAAKSEVDKMRANLEEQMRAASGAVGGNALILQRRESELRAALAVQKAKVMELNSARDELKVLTNEMESAQRAYEGASKRYTETMMEGQSNQSDIAILNRAVPPLGPARPKVLLNTLVSTLIGLFLGLTVCIAAEMQNRRVRSSQDLIDVLDVPVLGIIRLHPPKRRHIRFFARTL